MKTIETIEQICKLARQDNVDWRRFGDVYAKESGDLMIFNYTQQAQYNRRWNYFERVSRGLIINKKTGEIVARPFDKFFNWGEMIDEQQSMEISTITEKVDGSLGILYRNNGEFCIATRGSFDGEQAIWATQYLNENFDIESLPEHITLLFEIVYPKNRIVIDYGERTDIVLLAARNRLNGKYLPFSETEKLAHRYGFNLPRIYEFNTVENILKNLTKLDGNNEGYVVEFSDGKRLKFKGDKYKELHRMICALSFKNTLAAVSSGTIDQVIEQIPDEFLNQVNTWVSEINTTVEDIRKLADTHYKNAPKENRKVFAEYVMKECKHLAPYMFCMLDNKDIKQMIYKQAFRDNKLTTKG